MKKYIIQNQLITAIILFSVLFFTLLIGKPKFLFNKDDSLKQFGIGFQAKTVFPLWIFTITLAILSYSFVRFCVFSYT
jgi:hypothetical protein